MSDDKNTNISKLKEKIQKLCEDRDWDQFHPAKELAIGIITESSELLDIFRFKSEKEIETYFKNKKKKEEIEDEVADIAWFLLRFCQKYNIDLSKSISNKIKKFHKKYPVEKSKGSNKKYTELK